MKKVGGSAECWPNKLFQLRDLWEEDLLSFISDKRREKGKGHIENWNNILKIFYLSILRFLLGDSKYNKTVP